MKVPDSGTNEQVSSVCTSVKGSIPALLAFQCCILVIYMECYERVKLHRNSIIFFLF